MTRAVFTPEEIGPELLRTDERIRSAAVRGLQLAARLGRGRVVKEIRGNRPYPVVDTGELLRSVVVVKEEFGAVLEVTAPHADFQEFGTGPHAGQSQFTPPFDVIEAWALRKGRGSRQRKGSSQKTKKGAGQAATRRRGKESSASDARTRHVRKRTKAGRSGAKMRRASKRSAKSMAGAVWATIRRFGVKPKRYFERASKGFSEDVDRMVSDQVAKVSS